SPGKDLTGKVGDQERTFPGKVGDQESRVRKGKSWAHVWMRERKKGEIRRLFSCSVCQKNLGETRRSGQAGSVWDSWAEREEEEGVRMGGGGR
ncbi:unnamed protein product, partial [Staurois parvus]